MGFARVDVIRLEIQVANLCGRDTTLSSGSWRIRRTNARFLSQYRTQKRVNRRPTDFTWPLFLSLSPRPSFSLRLNLELGPFVRLLELGRPFSTSRSVASILETFADLRLLVNLSGKTFYLPLEALLTFRSHPPENVPTAHFVVDKITFNSVLRDSYVGKKITLSEGQNSSAEFLSPRFFETSSPSHLRLSIKHATCNSYNNF